LKKDHRRNKVMSALKDVGLRVQYSVFECDLDPRRLKELKARLSALINRRTDRLHIYPLCDACYFRSESLGMESRDLEA